MKSYYEILGVHPLSSQEEIKNTYKKLAKANHPDVGGDISYFKLISSAYSVIGDPDLREEYDWGLNNSIKNDDIVIIEHITLSDIIVSEHKVVIEYETSRNNANILEIIIPKNIKNNTFLKYDQLGDDYDVDLARGDLYVKIVVKNDTPWVIDNEDIAISVDVNVLDFILGRDIILYTPDKRVLKLPLSPNTPIKEVITIKNKGLMIEGTKKRGNVHVVINAVVPVIEDREIIDILVKFKNKKEK